MANVRSVKRRIRSASNISQITKAMQLVAASKMKKATEKAISGKPYAQKIFEMTTSFVQNIDPKKHPLLKPEGRGKKLIILVSTNKGLCGGLNTNLYRRVVLNFAKKEETVFVTVGRKGKGFVLRSSRQLTADFSQTLPFTQVVAPLTKMIVDGFLDGVYSHIFIFYNDFVSALKQVPKFKQILPITQLPIEQRQEVEKTDNSKKQFEILVEPSVEEILNALLINYLENQIRAAIIESEASEHSARMVAMKNATESANDLNSALTLEYNKIRQASITSEISDMVTARSAVGA